MTDLQTSAPSLLSSAMLQNPLSSPIDIHMKQRSDLASSVGSLEDYNERHTFASSTSSPLAALDGQEFDEAQGSPARSSSSLPSEYDARLGSHVQHFRVYGRSDDENASVREEDQSGPAFVHVALPAPATVWTRGKPAEIRWSVVDPSVQHVRIELMECGCAGVTIIAQDAPNSGAFAYNRVPWGMPCGSRYFLRLSASTDPSRFLTTACFTIDSAP